MLHTISQKVRTQLSCAFGICSLILPVVSALTNFTNVTLSSLYFDVTKDCLYADSADNMERMAIVGVLREVGIVILSFGFINHL